jgi:hypothetical protein
MALADQTQSTKTETKKSVGKDKSKMSSETTTTTDPGGAMNSTTDSAKTERSTEAMPSGHSKETVEKVKKHDAPGTKRDAKSHVKETTEKDSAGNVVNKEVETK